MNEHLPYEDELLKRMQELPLPNEDDSWEDMKRLLDDDDKQPPAIALLPKGCGRYGLLILVLLLTGLLTADPFKWFHPLSGKEKSPAIVSEDSTQQKKKDSPAKHQQPKPGNNSDTISLNTLPVLSGQTVISTSNATGSTEKKQARLKNDPADKSRKTSQQKQVILQQNKQAITPGNYLVTKNNESNKKKLPAIHKKIKGNAKINSSGAPETDSMEDVAKKADEPGSPQKSMTATVALDTIVKTATANDSLQQKPLTTSKKANKKDSSAKKAVFFSAGIGLQQLIPIAGQKANPFNALGRKNTWRDYIPSIYVRLNKDQHWFLQSGFRYAAPQFTKDIVFYQRKTVDSATASLTTNNSRVKKTYYHQLPISFHHYVFKGLSIGAGVQLNKFTSAIIEYQQLQSSLFNPGDSLVNSFTRHQKKADTNFVKMYLQGLIETQYHHKRFSGGLSYSFGLQPYLKFSLPGGEQKTASNRSLQLFIRYQLWRQ